MKYLIFFNQKQFHTENTRTSDRKCFEENLVLYGDYFGDSFQLNRGHFISIVSRFYDIVRMGVTKFLTVHRLKLSYWVK